MEEEKILRVLKEILDEVYVLSSIRNDLTEIKGILKRIEANLR